MEVPKIWLIVCMFFYVGQFSVSYPIPNLWFQFHSNRKHESTVTERNLPVTQTVNDAAYECATLPKETLAGYCISECDSNSNQRVNIYDYRMPCFCCNRNSQKDGGIEDEGFDSEAQLSPDNLNSRLTNLPWPKPVIVRQNNHFYYHLGAAILFGICFCIRLCCKCKKTSYDDSTTSYLTTSEVEPNNDQDPSPSA